MSLRKNRWTLDGYISCLVSFFSLGEGRDREMKKIVPKKQCEGCVWLINKKLCPFVRCVRWEGFIKHKG